MEPPNISLPCRQNNSITESIMSAHFTTRHGNMSRQSTSRANFSYPRLSRHESNESRSSNGSVPGMTDASDSDMSFDDDGSYNTSAGELWDSFWPDNAEPPSTYRYSQESQISLLQPKQHKDYLNIDPMCCQSGVVDNDETIKVAIRGYDWQEEKPPSPRTRTQPPSSQSTPLLTTPPRPAPKRSPVTYSVYPKPPVFNVPRLPHPPRTSSLSFEPPSPPRRSSFLRGSRSSAALRASKSTHNMHSLFIAPTTTPFNKVASSQQLSSTATNTAASVPVSPVYPPPPTPRTLRPSTSAFNLRDKVRMRSNTRGSTSQNHITAPPQLLPSPLPEPLPTRPQFVSVFELDSDSDSEADAAAEESRNFARRWARGLHKRSTVEKRGVVAERKVSSACGYGGGPVSTSDADSGDKGGDERLRDGGSLSRKRGGSLGRIFGFIGR